MLNCSDIPPFVIYLYPRETDVVISRLIKDYSCDEPAQVSCVLMILKQLFKKKQAAFTKAALAKEAAKEPASREGSS